MTIVIPTRNRAETLHYTLLTCVMQEYDDLEILVSDNCSNDGTEAVVSSFNDKRIRYIRTPKRLSMCGNFEYALSFVTSGFVGFLGDDDALMPAAVARAAEFIGTNNVKALTSKLALYRWPTAPETIRNTGRLEYTLSNDACRDSVEYMDKALKGTGGYYVHGLPSIYYGFVDVSLLKPRNGRFFHSMNLDAYAAFAVAAQLTQYGYLSEPLFIIGASGRSNGVSNFQQDADKTEAVSFAAENDIPFHPDYVFCRSIAVCVHEAFRQAMDQYPGLAEKVRADPHDLIRSMALEVDQYNKEQIYQGALYVGERNNIGAPEVEKIFNSKNAASAIAGENILMRISRYAKRKLTGKVAGKNMAIDYPDMLIHGVADCHQAAIFFQQVLSQSGKHRAEDQSRR